METTPTFTLLPTTNVESLVAQARLLIALARELKEIEDFELGQLLEDCSEICPETHVAEDRMLDHHYESQHEILGF